MIVLEARGKFQNPSAAEKETNAHYANAIIHQTLQEEARGSVGTKCPSFCQTTIKMVVITKITSQVFVSLRKCVNQPTNLNAVGYPLPNELI